MYSTVQNVLQKGISWEHSRIWYISLSRERVRIEEKFNDNWIPGDSSPFLKPGGPLNTRFDHAFSRLSVVFWDLQWDLRHALQCFLVSLIFFRFNHDCSSLSTDEFQERVAKKQVHDIVKSSPWKPWKTSVGARFSLDFPTELSGLWFKLRGLMEIRKTTPHGQQWKLNFGSTVVKFEFNRSSTDCVWFGRLKYSTAMINSGSNKSRASTQPSKPRRTWKLGWTEFDWVQLEVGRSSKAEHFCRKWTKRSLENQISVELLKMCTW